MCKYAPADTHVVDLVHASNPNIVQVMVLCFHVCCDAFHLMQYERLLPFLVCSVTCIAARIVLIFCMIQLQCCSSFKVKFVVVCVCYVDILQPILAH